MTTSVDSKISLSRPLILMGAGGHARVLLGLMNAIAMNAVGVCDPVIAKNNDRLWQGLRVLGNDARLKNYPLDKYDLALGIGRLTSGEIRTSIYQKYSALGYLFPPLVHPHAWVSSDVSLSPENIK